ncbi:cation:proton antiporter [Flavihumibacter sp. CACIAM 22H1]|uniref:cation:proton antiporter domain-containing protein n=1 Tax=Flavihumibacter sp. CACIAM 22H1 TaxID=1812911 RepID=UPI0007A8563D|nr:cation:proton antiporter [Flavihumibacter sp. CACIAM 22H1]KYP13440.1 MAG: sodium:proton antiporter [Flavihumibacter sp. CACIAM 22H1]
MAHLPVLIKDLALILGAAAITTLLFKRLKQPLVLGYIIAGLLVGPNFNFFPTIGDTENIKIWAEIGVVVLLFNLGLEFSFKKLMRVGGSASIAGIFEITGMFLLGYTTGSILGWSTMNCIFLGGIISISSTTIIIRAFEEQGLKSTSFASMVMGMLVIEDIVAVLLMVLLSTVAVSQQFSGLDLLIEVVKLVFFLSLWFLFGILVIPSFFRWVARWMNEETLLIISLGMCLGMVILATYAGFSAALGAFIMGSVLAETTQAEAIEHQMQPVKNLFGAVFFVSVGMLIDPGLLWEYRVPVIIITIAVILGKTINITIGSFISGQPLKQSLQAGMSMSQIGEFSFIIATLGVSLGVTSDFLYPIAVGVSVITTFSTPFMIKSALPLYKWLDKTLPLKWRNRLNRYSTGAQQIPADADWKMVFQTYFYAIVLNSVIILATIFLAVKFLDPWLVALLNQPITAHIVTVLVTLLVASPFIWALTIKKLQRGAYTSLWLNQQVNHGPLVMVEILRNLLAVFYLFLLLNQLFTVVIAIVGAVVVLAVVLFIFSQRLQAFYARIERRFMSNLNHRELTANSGANSTLSPWDAHLAYFVISPDADCLGMDLETLAWREKYGINIASIERGKKMITAPQRTEKIFPYDKLAIIGTDLQLQVFRPVVEPEALSGLTEEEEEIRLMKVRVDEHNQLKGKTIRNSGIREKTNGLVVGIERSGQRILNPASTTEFEWDDIVWIVGEREKIVDLIKAD